MRGKNKNRRSFNEHQILPDEEEPKTCKNKFHSNMSITAITFSKALIDYQNLNV